ncbi:MAG: 3-methyl-2-oxobutanoate hydroxymethyltransferase [Desulfovibrio sp.]|nr:3-methyl-2-oxobutanoate hydroxymethyltransferase [Desulfovibrio sp.]
MKNTVATLLAQKGQTKISMVTAYDYPTALIADSCGINTILVGDSLGMVVLGYDDTLSVTMDDMIHHCRAVARGAKNALIVCDMPYMSYHVSVEETVRNAGRLIQEGHAHAVKLEGGVEFVPEIRALHRASIPVVGHVGLTPQSINAFGGFKVQGKTREAAQKILDDARALQEAGAIALVLEGVPAALGAKITAALRIPTIGIGAGPACDGQVLVAHDLLGITEKSPKFVRRFADLRTSMQEAFAAFESAVKDGTFPASEHCYQVGSDDIFADIH